jgi:hypothetical protein
MLLVSHHSNNYAYNKPNLDSINPEIGDIDFNITKQGLILEPPKIRNFLSHITVGEKERFIREARNFWVAHRYLERVRYTNKMMDILNSAHSPIVREWVRVMLEKIKTINQNDVLYTGDKIVSQVLLNNQVMKDIPYNQPFIPGTMIFWTFN